MITIIVCEMLQLLWDKKMYFPHKNSDFGVYFYMNFFYQGHFSHALFIELSERIIVLFHW